MKHFKVIYVQIQHGEGNFLAPKSAHGEDVSALPSKLFVVFVTWAICQPNYPSSELLNLTYFSCQSVKVNMISNITFFSLSNACSWSPGVWFIGVLHLK